MYRTAGSRKLAKLRGHGRDYLFATTSRVLVDCKTKVASAAVILVNELTRIQFCKPKLFYLHTLRGSWIMDLFSDLKSLFGTSTTIIDNILFRLHYRATCATLLAFSILVTARQYIGDPIDCMGDKSVPEELLDAFCWVHGTYSMPDDWHQKVGVDVPYPGVGKHIEGKTRVYHAYYQWVCFVLFLQAGLFYAPRFFWKWMERGRLKSLVMGLNSPILPDGTKNANTKLLVNYMMANLGNHKLYFMCYVFAEILNFANVVGQIFLMDAFLGGEFSKYGTKVIEFTAWEGSVRFDPMVAVFPRLAKCTFHQYGSGGSVDKIDALCVLPVNVINEKIYIFLWFWFVLLALLSGLVLVYRLVSFLRTDVRLLVSRATAGCANRDQLEAILNKCDHGDWFLLNLLSKNLDSLNFRDFIKDFSKVLLKSNANEFTLP